LKDLAEVKAREDVKTFWALQAEAPGEAEVLKNDAGDGEMDMYPSTPVEFQ
jgi:hypothetical protein